MALTTHPTEPEAPPLAGARILVVDDHPFTIGLIKDVLYASGAGLVQSARDGEEALALLRECNPSLVVTDWRMPGMDGLAFTRIVRRAAIKPDPRVCDPQVPIVMLSAHATAKAVDRARRVGVNEVVVKPFTIASLLARLASAIHRPRDFVVCEAYVGPDRRRRDDDTAALGRRAEDRGDPVDHGPISTSAATNSVLRMLQKRLDMAEFESRRPGVRGRSRRG